MRILIFILALMSAFFVSADDLDLVPAKSIYIKGSCTYNYKLIGQDVSLSECGDLVIPYVNFDIFVYSNPSLDASNSLTFDRTNTNTGETTSGHSTAGRYNPSETDYVCPPDGNPLYTQKVGENQCGKPRDCPAGYHSKKVSQQLGSSECVPKECPPAGSSESLFSSPTIGGAPFDGGGLYCNDGCAYNVNASQISLAKFAMGVSQGVACGDKPYDNKKLADDADADKCTTSTDGSVNVLQCPDHHQPDPEDDPLDNSDSKVDDSKTPDKSKETCAEGDTSCNLKNVETEIENSINNLIDNDKELHNKKIDADTKNAKAFLNVMESIDTAILLQTSQDERLHAVTVGKFNELIDAVNGIETGGGGGGGNGTGNGNIGGQDCEGTIEECAGIGSGDGVELPQETRNLEQYAQKYNNWLPSAELPPEKCITLTNGKSLCFSFEYFIVFFQAISGLIVLSSLIHSASIIVRSV
ncbi:hypothetical protein [Pseudoalteromonas sp. PAR1]|uniref:hypothetical protein n=1 Tax=Pseudoalteromonas sp. PAR1 TaxID=2853443 RepID=UPI00248D38FC|nr:hypothetical protein [Pseudoalteromonas sp. PAR1]